MRIEHIAFSQKQNRFIKKYGFVYGVETIGSVGYDLFVGNIAVRINSYDPTVLYYTKEGRITNLAKLPPSFSDDVQKCQKITKEWKRTWKHN